jgi:hypothetical protein
MCISEEYIDETCVSDNCESCESNILFCDVCLEGYQMVEFPGHDYGFCLDTNEFDLDFEFSSVFNFDLPCI